MNKASVRRAITTLKKQNVPMSIITNSSTILEQVNSCMVRKDDEVTITIVLKDELIMPKKRIYIRKNKNKKHE